MAHGFLALFLFFWSLVWTTFSVVRKLPRKRTRNVSANMNTWGGKSRGKGGKGCQLWAAPLPQVPTPLWDLRTGLAQATHKLQGFAGGRQSSGPTG